MILRRAPSLHAASTCARWGVRFRLEAADSCSRRRAWGSPTLPPLARRTRPRRKACARPGSGASPRGVDRGGPGADAMRARRGGRGRRDGRRGDERPARAQKRAAAAEAWRAPPPRAATPSPRRERTRTSPRLARGRRRRAMGPRPRANGRGRSRLAPRTLPPPLPTRPDHETRDALALPFPEPFLSPASPPPSSPPWGATQASPPAGVVLLPEPPRRPPPAEVEAKESTRRRRLDATPGELPRRDSRPLPRLARRSRQSRLRVPPRRADRRARRRLRRHHHARHDSTPTPSPRTRAFPSASGGAEYPRRARVVARTAPRARASDASNARSPSL